MSNLFVKIPQRGDIVVGRISDSAKKFISLSSFVLADLDQTVYEIVGVVNYVEGRNVGIIYKTNTSKPACNRPWWYLSGYTLDGTARTGILSIRVAGDSWAANVSKTISYNASTIADLVSQLNTAFRGDSDFLAQDWYADTDGTTVRLTCTGTTWQQWAYNTASTGFALTGAMPESIALSRMRKKNGHDSGEGCISNMARAIAYFRSDLSSTTYNPSSDVTSIKRGYPVCLPAYLGTSQYQSDHCALLRETYGAGETGWLKFMKSMLPVIPTDFGAMGIKDGKARTAALAAQTWTSASQQTATPCCPGADYCANISGTTFAAGDFWLPTPKEIARILNGVLYGTDSSRDADILNKALLAIGGTAISNGSILWSCCRYDTVSFWFANGSYGFFGHSSPYSTLVCVPVSLLKIA